MGDGDRNVSGPPTVSATVREPGLMSVGHGRLHWRGRTKREKRLLLILLVLSLLMVVIVTLLVVVSERSKTMSKEKNLCTSAQCIRSAANYLRSIDPSVDPCEDFYGYACGRWGQAQPRAQVADSTDWFSLVNAAVVAEVRASLEGGDKDDDPEVLGMARIMYRNCMDTASMDRLGVRPLLEVTSQLGLSLPSTSSGGPVMTAPNLTLTLGLGLRGYGLDLLFSLSVISDPKDGTSNILYLGAAEGTSAYPWYDGYERMRRFGGRIKQGGRYRSELRSEHVWQKEDSPRADAMLLSHVMAYVSRKPSEVKQPEEYLPVVEAVLDLGVNVTQVLAASKTNTALQLMTIGKLQQVWDRVTSQSAAAKIDWLQYLRITSGLHNDLDRDHVLYVDLSEEAFTDLGTLLSATDPQLLNNYLWSEVTFALGRHTNHVMRTLHEDYMDEVYKDFRPPPRATYCTTAVSRLLGNAISYIFVDKAEETAVRSKVGPLMEAIKEASRTLVRRAHWLDEDTRRSCLHKVDDIVLLLGFPELVQDWYTLDTSYSGLTIEGHFFLHNMINVVRFHVKEMMAKVNEVNSREGWGVESGTSVNAFYVPQQNAVVVPHAMLRFPFYDLGLQVLDYAALGAVLGHQVTQAFDVTGRRGWTPRDLEGYGRRAQCLLEQYGNYSVSELGSQVDGWLTLDHNLGDNSGLREAWLAYRRSQRDDLEGHHKLPGLSQYTPDQLFFIAYANVWCEKRTKRSLEGDLQAEHSPSRFRVIGSVTNMPEFADTWQCTSGSTMNPARERCVVW